MKPVLRTLLIACAGFWCVSAAQAATWSSGQIDLPIPDDNDVTLTHSIAVGENVRLTDLTVTIAIDHTWVGDVQIWLENPSGQVVTLMDRPGIPPSPNLGDSSDFSADYPIRFNDIFETPADRAGNGCGDFQFVGVNCPSDFAPEQPLLAAFAGLPTGGEWTLTIRDALFGSSGTLASWSLEITGTEIPLPGAVWALGSAVLMLGAWRRRSATR